MFPTTEILELNGINITKLWEDRLSVLTCMPNLKKLFVKGCKNLKYLLSSAVCTSLVFQLEWLSVESCEDMEEVVAIREEPEGSKAISANVSLLFPELKHLDLKYLPKLKVFCKGDSVEFPLLSSLSIYGCSELKVSIDDSTDNEKQLEEMDTVDSVNEGILTNNQRCSGLQCFAPSFMSFHNLTYIFLEDLPKLKVFCKGDSVEFPNLTELQVSECHGLTYLLDSSTAKSLVQLKAMGVMCCQQMREIIKDCQEGETTNEGTEDGEFDFKRLEILVLHDLPTLNSFYSGKNAMRFPRLQKLFASHCPNMKSFALGIISTSVLMTVITKIYEAWLWKDISYLKNRATPARERWDGDVDTTIRKLWEENSITLRAKNPSSTDKDSDGEGTSSLGARM